MTSQRIFMVKENLCRPTLKIYDVLHSDKIGSRHYSTSAESKSSRGTSGTDTIKPISELPGLNTLSALKEFLKAKILNHNGLNVFDSRETLTLWKNMRNVYGPTFKMNIVGRPNVVVVTCPDDIENLYRMTEKNPIRLGLSSLKKARMMGTSDFGREGGILVDQNDEWRRIRSKAQTPMLKPKKILRYLKVMDNVSRDFTDRIHHLQKRYGEMPNSFLQEIQKFALEILGTVALDLRLGCLNPNVSVDSEQERVIKTVNNIFELVTIAHFEFPWWKYFPSPTLKKLAENHDLFLRFVLSCVNEAENNLRNRESYEDLSLLETFLLTEEFTKKDVVTFMVDLFIAGLDTTSNSLGFTLYLLARNKDKQKKLQEELDIILGDRKEAMTEAQLSKLSYLKACIKESQRLFPVVPQVSRMLEENVILGGFEVPKGHVVSAMFLLTSREEEYFQHSEEFIPERWMRDRPLGPIHPYSSLPFSHGTRMCIGRRIAELEMCVVLARIMQRFNIDYKYNDIEQVPRLTLVPSEPLRFEFVERK